MLGRLLFYLFDVWKLMLLRGYSFDAQPEQAAQAAGCSSAQRRSAVGVH